MVSSENASDYIVFCRILVLGLFTVRLFCIGEMILDHSFGYTAFPDAESQSFGRVPSCHAPGTLPLIIASDVDSSTIIEEIRAFCTSRQSHQVGYYYFSFNEPVTQKAESMLRSLMLQLLKSRSCIPDAIMDLYSRYEHEKPPLSDLLGCFRAIIETSGQTYLLIDALDECPAENKQRAMLIAMLDDIHQWRLHNLHILVTSRKEPDLSDLDRMVTFPAIDIQESLVDSDIRLHVQRQLQNDPTLSRWPLATKADIEIHITQGAHGM